MKNVNILIKPSSSHCNAACKYCFYADVSAHRECASYGMMTEKTLEILVQKAVSYTKNQCTFSFQGGEPTLIGLDFYKKLIEFQKKYNTKGVRIFNAIQTNGLVIDEEWAEFFGKHNFLVGLSLDGDKETHDFFRMDHQGKGTYDRVIQTSKLFNKYNVQYNILSVVTGISAGHGAKIVSDFCKKGFNFLQFIPCLEAFDSEPGKYVLTPSKYTKFLKATFDVYYEMFSKGTPISIRQFDNYINILLCMPPESCGMSGVCTGYFVVEGDGSVYPCDFYVLDEYRLGNICENDLIEMSESQIAKKFVEESKYIDEDCRSCKWFGLCRGGCRRYREPFIDDRPRLNIFCESYYDFFEYAYDRLVKIAQKVAANL